MKKFACALIFICFVLFMSACISPDPSHTHDYVTVKHNENAHWLECECTDKAAVEFHKGGNATCEDLAICSVCSAEYGTLESHSYTKHGKNETQHWLECTCGDKTTATDHSYTALNFDESEHWYECTCGDRISVASHSGGAATETEKAECSVCGFKYGETKKATEGLVFVLNEARTEYAVSDYRGTSETVYIPSTYEGKPVTAILDEAFAFNEAVFITSIAIPGSVTEIEDGAFRCAVKAVFYCEAKSKPRGWSNAWNYSRFDTYMPVVWDCNNSNVASDGYIYGITIDGINYAVKDSETKVVGTNIGADVTIPPSITHNGSNYTVSGIGCAALAFNNSSSADGLSTGSAITNISIPDTVTNIGKGSFFACYSLTSLDIPQGVTVIEWGAFTRCTSLKSVTIPNSVVIIGEYAFQVCALTSVVIPASVTSIRECAFMDCPDLTDIIVDGNNQSYASIDGNLYSKDGKNLLLYAPGKSDEIFKIPEGVASISAYAFYECSALKSVVVPISVTTAEARAFAWCPSLSIYCEAASRPDNWDANWLTSSGNAVYWSGEWGYDANEEPVAKKLAYVGEYVLHHVNKQPIGGGQATTYSIGDYYFGTTLSEYTIYAKINEGIGTDYISYNFGQPVSVSCNIVILNDSSAIAYLSSEVDLFNSGNATSIFYFDIVEVDGRVCFVLKATYGQSDYAYYVAKKQ